MDTHIRRVIQNRRAAHHEGQDMLTLLLTATDEAGHPLTDTEIRDELVTFLLASHETTANALTWTWLRLYQSSVVRARLTHTTVAAKATFKFNQFIYAVVPDITIAIARQPPTFSFIQSWHEETSNSNS
jgi:cytochrome P450